MKAKVLNFLVRRLDKGCPGLENFILKADELDESQVHTLIKAVERARVISNITIIYNYTRNFSPETWSAIFTAINNNSGIYQLKIKLDSNANIHYKVSSFSELFIKFLISTRNITHLEMLSKTNNIDATYLAEAIKKNTSIKYLIFSGLSKNAAKTINNSLKRNATVIYCHDGLQEIKTANWDKLWTYRSYLFRSWLIRNRRHPIMDPNAFKAVGTFLPQLKSLKNIEEVTKIWRSDKYAIGNVIAGNPKHLILHKFSTSSIVNSAISLTNEPRQHEKTKLSQENEILYLRNKIKLLEISQKRLLEYIVTMESNGKKELTRTNPM